MCETEACVNVPEFLELVSVPHCAIFHSVFQQFFLYSGGLCRSVFNPGIIAGATLKLINPPKMLGSMVTMILLLCIVVLACFDCLRIVRMFGKNYCSYFISDFFNTNTH